MRLLIALLLLVNALLLAMTAGLLPRPSPEAARADVEQPLRPDRLRILAAVPGHDATNLPPQADHSPHSAEVASATRPWSSSIAAGAWRSRPTPRAGPPPSCRA